MRTFFLLPLLFAPLGGQDLTVSAGTEWRQASVGRPWMLRLEAKGATGQLAWRIDEGALPPGIHLIDAAMVMLGAQPGAALYGAAAAAGDYPVKLVASDADGREAAGWVSLGVSLLSLKEAVATAQVGQPARWKLEVLDGVAPFTVTPGDEAFLPLGLTLQDGTLSGEAAIAGRFEIPVAVRDAGQNLLKTTVGVIVYGPDSALPPLAVRLRRDGCRVTAEWTPVSDEFEVRAYGGEGETPLEIEVTHRQSGERATGRYPAPGPCPSASPSTEP
ncbi:MAG: hypothetical protein HY821_13830 [Acidobacteria bacterium]|nr:hypothetical protein [Acidobacteriota bacterium]